MDNGFRMELIGAARRWACCALVVATLLPADRGAYAEAPAAPRVSLVVARDEKMGRQVLEKNVGDILKTFEALKVPFLPGTRTLLERTAKLNDFDAIGAIQMDLDRYSLLAVSLSDEAWFSIKPASSRAADRPLVKGRWQTFLVKVDNSSRVTSPLGARSAQALPTLSEENQKSTEYCTEQPHDWSQWFLMRIIGPPLMPAYMSGKEVEYFVMQLCSLDAGDRAAEFTFYLGGGQVSQGHYGATWMLFNPTEPVVKQ